MGQLRARHVCDLVVLMMRPASANHGRAPGACLRPCGPRGRGAKHCEMGSPYLELGEFGSVGMPRQDDPRYGHSWAASAPKLRCRWSSGNLGSRRMFGAGFSGQMRLGSATARFVLTRHADRTHFRPTPIEEAPSRNDSANLNFRARRGRGVHTVRLVHGVDMGYAHVLCGHFVIRMLPSSHECIPSNSNVSRLVRLRLRAMGCPSRCTMYDVRMALCPLPPGLVQWWQLDVAKRHGLRMRSVVGVQGPLRAARRRAIGACF